MTAGDPAPTVEPTERVSRESRRRGDRHAGSSDAADASAGMRILIADDNQDAAIILSIVLKRYGHQVCIAHNGIQTLDVAETFRPDVVLMDIGMPKLNGFDAARQIRKRPWGKSTFLVAVTGWGGEEDKRQATAAGFDHHLLKPVELGKLEKLLAEHRQSSATK